MVKRRIERVISVAKDPFIFTIEHLNKQPINPNQAGYLTKKNIIRRVPSYLAVHLCGLLDRTYPLPSENSISDNCGYMALAEPQKILYI